MTSSHGRTPMFGSQTPMYGTGSRTPMYGSQTPLHDGKKEKKSEDFRFEYAFKGSDLVATLLHFPLTSQQRRVVCLASL